MGPRGEDPCAGDVESDGRVQLRCSGRWKRSGTTSAWPRGRKPRRARRPAARRPARPHRRPGRRRVDAARPPRCRPARPDRAEALADYLRARRCCWCWTTASTCWTRARLVDALLRAAPRWRSWRPADGAGGRRRGTYVPSPRCRCPPTDALDPTAADSEAVAPVRRARPRRPRRTSPSRRGPRGTVARDLPQPGRPAAGPRAGRRPGARPSTRSGSRDRLDDRFRLLRRAPGGRRPASRPCGPRSTGATTC